MYIEIRSKRGDILVSGQYLDLKSAVESNREHLKGAELRGANLESADLRGARMKGANLADANLNAAKLKGANLEYADLRHAYLFGANLEGAKMKGTKLTPIDTSDAD